MPSTKPPPTICTLFHAYGTVGGCFTGATCDATAARMATASIPDKGLKSIGTPSSSPILAGGRPRCRGKFFDQTAGLRERTLLADSFGRETARHSDFFR